MDGEMYIRQAYESIYQGDFESAITLFGRAISTDPHNAAYLYSGSITCARSGKLSLAMTYAQKAVELHPDEPAYQLNVRMIMSRMRIAEVRDILEQPSPDIEKCLVLLKEAAQLDPLSVESRLLLGILYRLQQNYKLALESLRDVLLLEPQHEEAKRLLHEVRAERRRLLKQQYSYYHSKRNR